MGIRCNKFSANLMAIILTILLLPMAAYGLPGDLNGSGRVDGFDLIMFGRANGSVAADDTWNPDADMNRDGTVDNKDLDILAAHFGKNGMSFGLWVGSASGTEKVFKLSSTGNILQRIGAFNKPVSISGDIRDNTVWVADSNDDRVVKLSGFDGTQILSVSGINPYSVSTDPRDGSVWVADYANNRVVKLLPSVTDGYAVGTDTGSHMVFSGFKSPRWVSVNSDTGEVWVADTGNHAVVRLSPDIPDGYDIQTDIGSHSTKSGFNSPYCVSVNNADGTAWVADYGNNQVVKLSATATTEVIRVSGFNQPIALDTSTTDGSVWVADYNNKQVVRLSADGSLVCRVGGFSNPYSVGVNPLDGSAWVADYNNDQVVRLSPNGTELMRISGITRPIGISIISQEVSDKRYPVATATLNVKTAASGEIITFTGTGNDPDGSITLYEWDFDGDGNVDFSSSTTGMTTHTYTAEGLYNPILKVIDNDWLTATDYSQIVRIGALKAMADADVTSGNAPLAVSFTGEFVDPIDGFVESFQWDFDGDNIFDYFSETSPETTHTYNEPGHYVATFKVTDGSYTATDQISIDVDISSPMAEVSASPDAGAAPLNVIFSGSGIDPDGIVMLYEWDFEDDGTYDWFSISDPDTSFVYENDGSYTARLRVTDNDGLTGTATTSIEVGTAVVPLTIVANADKTSGRVPLKVNFNAIGSSTEIITKYEWNFGDCSLFSDSMELGSGNFQADSPWGLVQSDSHSKNSSWTDSPGGDYSENADQSLTSISLNLSTVTTATLSFWHRYETEQYYDSCRVEISIDGGNVWSQLKSFSGSQPQWTEVTSDISSYLPNADVRIRFRFTSNDNTNYDGWYIDDVRICSSEADWTETSGSSIDGSISHTYNQSGRFAATLRITDSGDNQKTDTININIDPAVFPEATADANPKTGETPLTVTFTAIASDTDGTIRDYDWNFGEEYVWVADYSNDQVVRVCQDGSCEMVRSDGFNDPYSVSINPNDGTVWIADYYNNEIVRLSANGQTELVRIGGFYRPASVSVNPADGTVWVADYYHNQVVKLASNGTELVRLNGFSRPYCVSVNQADGSVWVADYGNHQVVKLASDGTGLARISGFSNPFSLAVNSTDGTVWVANTGSDTVTRLASDIRDGYHIGQDTESHLVIEGFNDPYSLAVNITDNTVWVADYYNHQVVHLASDGSELLRLNGFYYPTGVAVNSSTGVAWVADSYNNQIVKLSPDGKELARLSGFNRPRAVAISDTGSQNYYNSSTSGNTTHAYTMPGIYHAVFTATDDDNNVISQSVDISVLSSPAVVADSNTNKGSAPLEVFLTAKITELSGTITQYEWDFDGDGTYDAVSEISPNALHVFQTAGTYTSTIRVTTDIGYSNTDSVTITVTPTPPQAQALAVPVEGNTPLVVTFNGSGTDIDGTIVKYEWDFENDGIIDFTSPTTGETTHTYTAANTYTAALKVTDSDGLSATDNVDIFVKASTDPSAFIYSPDSQGFSPYDVQFYVHGINPNGTIATYEIDFDGDGTFETIQPTAFGDNMENNPNYWTPGESWARVATDSHSPSYCWTDSPATNYSDSADTSLTSSTIDLSSASAPKLIFWHKYSFKSGDYGRVEVSNNDGVSWYQVKYFSNATLSKWTREVIDLSSYAGNATVKIRFRLTSNTADTADGWYIDDVWAGDFLDHTYTTHGDYTVVLRVTDNEGNSTVTTQTISIVAGENTTNIWVADYYNNRIVKLSDMGDTLVTVTGFNRPRVVEANPVTGDVWVSDTNNDRVIKLSKDVPDGYNVSLSDNHLIVTGFNDPWGLSVNTSDNSVWVADRTHHQVVKLDSNGTEIKRINGFYNPSDIVVNPGDGTVWVSDTTNGRIVKLASDVPDGFVASASGITPDNTSNQNFGMMIGDVSADTGKLSDSLWFDGRGDYLVISPYPALDVQDFTIEAWVKGNYITDRALFMRGNESGENELYFGFDNATTILAIIDNDTSVYFSGEVDFTDGEWHHVALVYDSAQLRCFVDGAAYGDPAAVAATLDFGNSQALIGADFDSFNSSLGNYYKGHIDDVRLWNVPRTETEIKVGKGAEISSSSQGLVGYWKLNTVSDSYSQISTGFNDPYGLSLDLSDNGVWVADFYNDQVVKLASNGSQVHRKSGYYRPYSLSLNPNDRMVWVADHENDRLVKLRSDGLETAWATGFNNPHDVAVNPDDSTVWVADYLHNQVVKLAPDGTELLRIGGFNYPLSISIDPAKRDLVQPPTATVNATPTSGAVSLDVTFTGSGSDNNGSITNYSWDFEGDGIYDYTSATTGNTTHAYTTPGTYSPIFRVTDDAGLMVYATPGIIYAGPITVIPSASPQSGNAPLKVDLDGHVTGLAKDITITNYEWDYDGDGMFDYESQAGPGSSYTYSPGGKYTAILRVTDTLGNQAYASIDIQVTKQPPTVSNSATPTTGNAPLSVSLNGSGSDKDGSIIRYEWDYDGDGTYDWFSTSESNTFFTYKTAGTYDAVIRVTDNDGLTATAIKTITVAEKQNPPMANASASITKGSVPLTVTLTGTGTDVDGQIQLYEWDFDGDGTYDYSSADTGNTSHIYSITGLFHPLFRVTDADGLTATADLLITAQKSGAPIANANAGPNTGATPLTVSFDADGSSDPGGNIVRYDWSFGKDMAWVADYSSHKVHRLNGYQIDTTLDGFNYPYRLSINPDGTLWLSDHSNNQIVKLSADGKGELSRTDGFNRPYGVSTDPADGGVWVADYNNHQVVKLDGDGNETLRVGGFDNPTSVAVYSDDSSVWITDRDHHQIVKLDSDGNQLARIDGFNRPFWVSVNQNDGSAWIADRYNHRVIKLSENTPSGYNTGVKSVTPEALSGAYAMLLGDTAAETGKLSGAITLDGSGDYVLISEDVLPDVENFTIEAWVKGSYVNNRTIFMRGNASGGNEIYFGFYNTTTIEAIVADQSNRRFSGSVNFTDGNWHHVALTYDATAETLSCYVDGSEYGTPFSSVSADLDFEGSHALIGADFDSFNGSMGNYFTGQIDEVRMWNVPRTSAQITAAKDQELAGTEAGLVGYWKLNILQATPYHKMLTGFNEPVHIAISPLDGSAWVCDYMNNQMVRVSPDCTREIVRVDGFNRPHEAVVSSSDGNVWVADHYNNQIAVLTATGRELRRISGFYRPTSVVLVPQSGNLISLTSDQTITHTYPEIGEYIASLTVTDNDGNTDTDTVAINAGTYPEAIAIAYPTSGTVPLTVRFAANGNSHNGTIEYFSWDFDGNGSTDWTTRISENKEYTFNQPGIYTASLTVTDNRGLKDVKQVTIIVLASDDAPVVSASANPAEGNAPLDVMLTGLAKDSDGTIVKHEWDFDGDGTFDYTSTVSGITSHIYTDIGVYNAKLRVTDNDGNQGTGTARVEVKADGAPTAKAQASVTHGAAALDVQFTGSGSDGDIIIKYEWDFDGDGTYDASSTDTGNISHTYTIPGSFNAVLRVTDDAGLTDTASINILVAAGITASLSQDSFDPTVGETIDINSVLTAAAKVTILVTDRTGSPIRTLVKAVSRLPGYYSDTWNGKDEGGQVLESGAYLYVIKYETGGQKYIYDLTNNISLKIAKITPTYPTTFNPLNADTNFFRYELDIKSEVTVYISPFRGGAQDRIKTLLLRQPQKAGNYVLTWDGTDDSGNLVASESYVLAVFRWYLPENAIIINTRPIISDPLINPAYLNPDALPYSDENQAIMSYTLSKKADVSLTIYDSLNYIVKSITIKDVLAGPGNIIKWDGKNTDGENVTPGIYRTKLIATDANGNKSHDANALLIIFY